MRACTTFGVRAPAEYTVKRSLCSVFRDYNISVISVTYDGLILRVNWESCSELGDMLKRNPINTLRHIADL
jgi:hypothetical protein